jgi:hypothetical protein
MNGKVIALLLVSLGTGLTEAGAHAEPLHPEAAANPPEFARDTTTWLDMQRAGAHAGKPNPLPGEATARAYERYLKSFEAPIPERFQYQQLRSND